jgi:hypothetical protein
MDILDECMIPAREELDRLLDAELLRGVNLALQQMAEAIQQERSANEAVKIYLAYQAERYKRGILIEL